MNNEICATPSGERAIKCISDRGLALDQRNDQATFKALIAKRQQSASTVIDTVADALLATDQADAGKKETKYVLDMTEGMKDAIDSGRIKLDTNKAGEIFAQFKDENGQYGKKIPVKKELIDHGVDPAEVAVAIQLKSIQEKLERIAEALDEISEGVAEVNKGLHNDRIGMYLAGYSMYLESLEILDPQMRKLIQSQAIKSLSESGFQMQLEIQNDVRYLTEGEYESAKRGRMKLINEKVSNINQCFEVVHKAALLKAAIYQESNELGAMLSAIDSYEQFLELTVAPNAGKLSELDVSDNLLSGGKWERQVERLVELKDARATLDQGGSYRLDVPSNEEDDENE